MHSHACSFGYCYAQSDTEVQADPGAGQLRAARTPDANPLA